MIWNMRTLALILLTFVVAACTSHQSRYVPLQETYDALPSDFQIEVYRYNLPERPFKRVARLDVHIEKTHFLSTDFEDALPELMEQARLSGSQAVIEIEERTSALLETKIYHLSAIGIRFVDED